MDPNQNQNYMESGGNPFLKWGIGILALVVIVGGLIYAARTRTASDTTSGGLTTDDNPAALTKTLNVKHQYKDGMHAYAGDLEVPTPCHTVATSAFADSNNEKKVTLAITLTASQDPCIQVITTKQFNVLFTGVRDVEVSAILDGEQVRLNVFEVPGDENIDTFELFIKG